MILVSAIDLVRDLNIKVLCVILDVSPDRSVPVVWLSGILQSLNADLKFRLYPATSKRQLTMITIDQAAKIAGGQSYLRKLCRGSMVSRHDGLQLLKRKCTNVQKARPTDELHYPHDSDDEAPAAICDAEDTSLGVPVQASSYDRLIATMPSVLTDLDQSKRNEVLNDFCEKLSGPDIQNNLVMRAKTLLSLQQSHAMSCMEAQAIYEWISDAAKVTMEEKVIVLEDSGDEKPPGGHP